MQSKIRGAALELGFLDAKPATGHPFEVWHNRLMGSELGKYMSMEYDPAKVSGWPLKEITLWTAIAPTPPMADWPDGRGEIGGFYMRSGERQKLRDTWDDAVAALGYEIIRGVMLPERAVAIRAGLGVHGLNGLMIAPDYGSFVSIHVVLVHAALQKPYWRKRRKDMRRANWLNWPTAQKSLSGAVIKKRYFRSVIREIIKNL